MWRECACIRARGRPPSDALLPSRALRWAVVCGTACDTCRRRALRDLSYNRLLSISNATFLGLPKLGTLCVLLRRAAAAAIRAAARSLRAPMCELVGFGGAARH